MPWSIAFHPEVLNWIKKLNTSDYLKVRIALEMLEVEGPMLHRPLVDHVKGSSFKNMKELRPRGGYLRLLFAFDPNRSAIFLVAGDKRNNWNEWYEKNLPIADQRFREHLKSIERNINGE